MADVLTPEQRHNCMSSVRRENTSPELFLRSILHKAGLRYRLHDRRLPGSPDIVFFLAFGLYCSYMAVTGILMAAIRQPFRDHGGNSGRKSSGKTGNVICGMSDPFAKRIGAL